MNKRIKIRLFGLAAGIGLMGLAIGFMTVQSQRRAGELRVQLKQVDAESFRIADEFRDLLRQLNGSLQRYGADRHPEDLEAFTRASKELDLWIDAQKPKLTTQPEQALMQSIDAAYDDYLLTAKALLTRLEGLGPASATIADYRGLTKESQHLFDLGQALAKAHFSSRGIVLAQANQAISDLRVMVLASLGCLLIFVAALSIAVYRDMIAPLRIKLVESQALIERQEKLASLGMLAAGVAHEIRNPLTAIKAALFLQEKKFQPGSVEYEDAKLVEREILRLERIVNDFLKFARPTEPELAVAQTDNILREVHDLLAPALVKDHIELTLESSLPLRVKVDAAQIKQVLINLVQNAADAIGQNGVVKLRARAGRQTLNGNPTDVVILEVEDSGKGIPPNVQKRLFDPFFTTKDTGTGLGLPIAAGIVQKHGGTLQYQTLVHHGTTFGIVLPLATE